MTESTNMVLIGTCRYIGNCLPAIHSLGQLSHAILDSFCYGWKGVGGMPFKVAGYSSCQTETWINGVKRSMSL